VLKLRLQQLLQMQRHYASEYSTGVQRQLQYVGLVGIWGGVHYL
jgi:hypothetical protein